MISQIPNPEAPYTYYQANTGDSSKSGNLWSSKNIDLTTNRGVMRVAGRMIAGETTTTEVLITSYPIAFISYQGDYYCIAGGRILKTAGLDPDSGWSEDTGTGYKTNYDDYDSDLAVFDGKLWASNTDGWYTKDSSTSAWTQTTGLSSNGITEYFRRTDRLYVVETSDELASIDDAGAFVSAPGDYAISLTQATDNQITCLTSNTDSIWIGTQNKKEEVRRASIFRWDGVKAQVSEIYRLKSTQVFALEVMNDVPYCFDNHGVLSKFTGSTFEEVGRIPLFNGSGANDFPYGSQETLGDARIMHFNGMKVTKNGTILCNITNLLEDSDVTTLENSSSGIWEWSPEFGFTHKHSFSYTPRDSTTVTDYGQNRMRRAGALFLADSAEDANGRNGTILAGAELFTDSDDQTGDLFGIFYDDYRNTVEKKGYFVTTWINSTQIQDKWERLWIKYKRLLNSTDSIVCKYRLYEEDPTSQVVITWVDTTSFTTTTDITAYDPSVSGFDGVTGGEVEFIQGVGSGACVHITDISEAGGTYTVTIDEAVTGATTTTGRARFQKWIKLNPSDPDTGTNIEFQQMAIGASSCNIQLKVCMTFDGTNQEFDKLALVSNEDIIISP